MTMPLRWMKPVTRRSPGHPGLSSRHLLPGPNALAVRCGDASLARHRRALTRMGPGDKPRDDSVVWSRLAYSSATSPTGRTSARSAVKQTRAVSPSRNSGRLPELVIDMTMSLAPSPRRKTEKNEPSNSLCTTWLSMTFSAGAWRSEEHTSELQSLMRTSYTVSCLKQKQHDKHKTEYLQQD